MIVREDITKKWSLGLGQAARTVWSTIQLAEREAFRGRVARVVEDLEACKKKGH